MVRLERQRHRNRADFPNEFRRFIDLTETATWTPLSEWIRAKLGIDHDLMRYVLFGKHGIELGVVEALTDAAFLDPNVMMQAPLYHLRMREFVRAFLDLFDALRPHKLEEKLLHAMKNEVDRNNRDSLGLGAIETEMRTMNRYLGNDFEVFIVDLAQRKPKGQSYDLHVARAGSFVEVECKATSLETGKKLNAMDVGEMFSSLSSVARAVMDGKSGGIYISLTKESWKEPSMDTVRAAFEAAATGKAPSGGISSTTQKFSIVGSPFTSPQPDPQDVRAFLATQFGSQRGYFGWWREGACTIVLELTTTLQPNWAEQRIKDWVLKASGQFEEKGPCALHVGIVDLAPQMMLQLPLVRHGGRSLQSDLDEIAKGLFNGLPCLQYVDFSGPWFGQRGSASGQLLLPNAVTVSSAHYKCERPRGAASAGP